MRPISYDAKAQIIRNLRANNENLAKFSDEQIFKAWDAWSESDEYPDESKIADWIDEE